MKESYGDGRSRAGAERPRAKHAPLSAIDMVIESGERLSGDAIWEHAASVRSARSRR